jgi:hypothetical protein
MRKLLALAAAMSLLATSLPAQTDAEYQNWMKTAAAASASLQKNVTDKKFDAAVADARKIEDTFKQVEAFWRSRNMPDAMNFARQVQNEALTVDKAITTGDMERSYLQSVVGMMAGNVSGSCGGCHNAHRQRLPDGSFKIK